MVQSDTKKTQILLAAGPIFAQKGFKSTTVREICDAAGVNLASVNYYFGDKHGLYLQTVVLARQMQADRVPEPEWDANVSPEEKLRGYIVLILDRLVALKSAPWQVQLLMREVIQPTDACRDMVQEYFKIFLNVLMGIIDELAERSLAQDQRLKLAFSVVGQCMFYRFAGGLVSGLIDQAPISAQFQSTFLADHITNFSLAAITNLSGSSSDQTTAAISFSGRESINNG